MDWLCPYLKGKLFLILIFFFTVSFWNVDTVLICLPPSLNVQYLVTCYHATHVILIGKSSTPQLCLSCSWDSRGVCTFMYRSCKLGYQTSSVPWKHYKHVIWVIYIQNMSNTALQYLGRTSEDSVAQTTVVFFCLGGKPTTAAINDWNSYSALRLSAEMETFLFPWFWSCCLVAVFFYPVEIQTTSWTWKCSVQGYAWATRDVSWFMFRTSNSK